MPRALADKLVDFPINRKVYHAHAFQQQEEQEDSGSNQLQVPNTRHCPTVLPSRRSSESNRSAAVSQIQPVHEGHFLHFPADTVHVA